jgi:nicotinamide-nucleotide amidase
VNIEIVTIGDELLLGATIDTNAAYLARDLATLGVSVVRRTTCGDDPEAIADAIRDTLARTGAVITTGGLGPTADDRTKASIAAVFGRDLIFDESIAAGLRQLWRDRGRPGELPQSNYAQAMIPDGARVLPNTHGTAPGIWLDDEQGRWVAMLPGVPREMRGMYTDALRPLIHAQVGNDTGVVRSRTVRTTGVAESSLAEQLGELGQGFGGLSLAFLPNHAGVDLRLTSRGRPPAETESLLDEGAAVLQAQVGMAAYGIDDISLAEVVHDVCRAHMLRLAVAESCTGGLLGARLTDIPGASSVFHGGLIAYDNRVKRLILGVLDSDIETHGAVSEPVVLQMARGIRIRLGTEIGVAITGIAGPTGGTPDKPVGTVWIGIDVAEGRPPIPRPEGYPPIEPFQQARLFRMIGDRDEIRHRAAQAALDFVRRAVLAMPTQ